MEEDMKPLWVVGQDKSRTSQDHAEQAGDLEEVDPTGQVDLTGPKLPRQDDFHEQKQRDSDLDPHQRVCEHRVRPGVASVVEQDQVHDL